MLVVAIEWPGAKDGGGRRDIATADCQDGQLHAIHVGLSREGVRHWLCDKKAALDASLGGCEMVVGLDFAFSLQLWFARDVLHASTVTGVCDVVAAEAERWLDGSPPWPSGGGATRPLARSCRPRRPFGKRSGTWRC
jgi:hypothetical protein